MRRSTLSLALFIALPLALAGCGMPQTSQVTQKAQDTFTSIHDAINRSLTVRCEYTDENGQKTVAYIKGNKVRMDASTEDAETKTTVNTHGIIKENKMWIWADGQKQGLAIDLSKAKDNNLKMGDTPINSQDDVITKLEGEKDKCQVSSLADSQFDVPADISFQSFGN